MSSPGPRNSWFWLSVYVAVVSGALLVSDYVQNPSVFHLGQPISTPSNPISPPANQAPTALVPQNTTPAAPPTTVTTTPAANSTFPVPNLIPAAPPATTATTPAANPAPAAPSTPAITPAANVAPAAPNPAPAATSPSTTTPAATTTAAAPSASLQPGHPFTAGNGMELNWVDPMKGWVGKYLVTEAEYEKVMGTNPSQFKGPRRPVDSVSWDDAMEYCRKLTEQDHASGLLPLGYKYSLPTDAQYDIFVGDASLDDAITSLNGNRTEDTDVGTKSPNEYGLYDTRGELLEWCLDWYDRSIYEKDSAHNKSEAFIGQSCRVLRGGNWGYSGIYGALAVACRYNSPPGVRVYTFGFRVVVVPDSAAPTSNTASPPSANSAPAAQNPASATASATPPANVPATPNPVSAATSPSTTTTAANTTTAATASSSQIDTGTPSTSLQLGQDFTAGNLMEMTWVDPMKGWVGKYLVTNAEYEKVMGTNPSHFKGPRRPVDSVSFNDAMEYCRKLTKQDHASGLLPVVYKYTLPTRAQYDIFVGNASLDDAVTSQNEKRTEDTDVGTKSPNEYGLYDARGDLWEWCSDWVVTDFGKLYPQFAERDKYLPLRGGAWDENSPVRLKAACVIDGNHGSTGMVDDGFRVVVVPAQ